MLPFGPNSIVDLALRLRIISYTVSHRYRWLLLWIKPSDRQQDFERRQEQQYNPRSFRRNQPLNTAVSRIHPQQYQQQYMNNYSRQSIHQPSAPITSTPVQQRLTSDDMDIDFARRGPLTSSDRQKRLSQELCLVCGQSGHLKATCFKSNSRFKPQRQIQAIEMEHSQHQDPGKQSRPTLSRDLDSAVKLFPPEILRTDMMNIEDGNGLDSCDRDNSTRGMGVRGTEVNCKSHYLNFLPRCCVWLMGTPRLVDSSDRSTPITYWKACGDGNFYVTDLCHGFILGYSWLERHNPRINWVSRMVEFNSSYCLENCCDGSSRIQGLGKPPDISKTFESPLAPDSTSTPVELSPISCSLSDSISLESMQSECIPLSKYLQFRMSVFLRISCPVFFVLFQRTRPKFFLSIETLTARLN
ncbi:hypothetical protein BASA83_007659 [Batrachochytrium salamandrivorans]|nr:hypothetical protein BASA83_007659 [Batrachochytrium salamandrivorans]